MMNNEEEVARLRMLLASAVRFSNITQRHVESRLGLSTGSLSRLFSGGIDLKVRHILDICEVIGLSPARFFNAAFPPEPVGGLAESASRREAGDRLERLLVQLHPEIGTKAAVVEPMRAAQAGPSQSDIERMVMAALGRLFASTDGAT